MAWQRGKRFQSTPLKMPRLTHPVSSEFLRYFAASLVALAADTITLSVCLRLLGLPLSWAATAGFFLGAAVAYTLSVRWVFHQRAIAQAPTLEFLAFVSIGIVGLGVTQVVLWVGTVRLQLLPEAVKLAAAAITFIFNFVVRKVMLFATSRRIRSVKETLT